MQLYSRTALRAARPGRLWLLRSAAIAMALGAAIWPSLALANPPRPSWDPGDPYTPVTQPHSTEVLEISHLFWVILILGGIILIGIIAAIAISVVRFSHHEGDEEIEPPQVFGDRRVEILWTVIPTVILMIAFVATVKAMADINNPGSNRALFDVNVIGHQWWWEFQYTQYHIDTANEVHIPTGVYVRFHVTSADVIHSFWVPQLQRQIDANPGPLNTNSVYLKADTPGVFAGACYEYCGAAHAWMKFKEVVQSPAQFQAWVKHEQQPAAKPTGEAAAGLNIFLHQTCVTCHAINGTSAGGAVGPNLTHVGSRWAIASGAAPVTVPDVQEWIRHPDTYKQGVVMPGFPFLPTKDLHALATYIVSLK
jgi:cytochrome c oxidase subunit 2